MRVVGETTDLDRLAPAWAALAARVGNPMLSPSWTRASLETLHARDVALHVVVVGGLDRPRAIAPFASRGVEGRLELVGCREMFEPMDLLYEDDAALRELVGAIARLRVPLELGRLVAGTPATAALKEALRGRGLVVDREMPAAPWLRLGPDWAQPETKLNSGRRSDLRRMARRASECGDVTWELLSPTPANVRALLREAYDVEKESWKAEAGTALAVDPVRGPFFRRLAELAAASGHLRVAFLRIGGRPAAMQLAMEYGNRYWLFKVGYDQRFSRCSPGTLLMVRTIADAAARGLSGFELLGSPEPWLDVWSPERRPTVATRYYPVRARGLIALGVDAARLARKRWASAPPRGIAHTSAG